MYCKNCGRLLKEGTRFCDRCGQSVRQNKQLSEREARRRELESLQEERLNRKKRMAYKEEQQARKKQQKKSHKKRNAALTFVFMILLIALISAIISYHINTPEKGTPPLGGATETPSATMSASSPTTPPVSASTNGNEENTTASSDYELFRVNNIVCPYPKGFISKTVSGNTRLSLSDTAGGASMTVSIESNNSLPTTDLMREYASQVGGTIVDSLADSKGFSVTAEKDNIVYHRKCMLDGNNIIYYDFQYSTGSAKVQQYRENIAYIDSVMDN